MNTTCWTLIEGAANGHTDERDLFARRYDPVIRAYLAARWSGRELAQDVADAAQDVFIECFREGGPLERVQRGYGGGFRAYLFGIIRIVALRWESKRAKESARSQVQAAELNDISSREDSLTRVFDQAWAKAVMQEAAERQGENAERAGSEAVRRVELLQLRFAEGMPIRDIASKWDCDPAQLHREYAKARKEFHQALKEVVASHQPGASSADVDRACNDLLGLLG